MLSWLPVMHQLTVFWTRATIKASSSRFFFFNDTATTEIYTLSLHDALPISLSGRDEFETWHALHALLSANVIRIQRSEEHTSELQSRLHLVCRLLLEKKTKSKNESV